MGIPISEKSNFMRVSGNLGYVLIKSTGFISANERNRRHQNGRIELYRDGCSAFQSYARKHVEVEGKMDELDLGKMSLSK